MPKTQLRSAHALRARVSKEEAAPIGPHASRRVAARAAMLLSMRVKAGCAWIKSTGNRFSALIPTFASTRGMRKDQLAC